MQTNPRMRVLKIYKSVNQNTISSGCGARIDQAIILMNELPALCYTHLVSGSSRLLKVNQTRVKVL